MRRNLLIALLSASFLLAGCSEGGGGDDGGDAGDDPTIARGDSLGEWTTSFTGGPLVGVEAVDADGNPTCASLPTGVGSHPFTLPANSEDGVAWRASDLTVTLTKDNEASVELDIYLFDADGDELGANTEFDAQSSSWDTLTVTNLSPGDYTVEIHACAPSPGYTVDVTASMVATEDVFE